MNSLSTNTTTTMDTEFVLIKQVVAAKARLIEYIGYCTSSIFLIIAIMIFKICPVLKNKRFKIHLCLFLTMLVFAVIRLTQMTFMQTYEEESYHSNNFTYMCTTTIVLKECAKSSVLGWMLVEGLYLSYQISKRAITLDFPLKKYTALAWGLPPLNIAAWMMYASYKGENFTRCWFGYNTKDLFWLVDGPRIIIILININILVNVIKALITKLRRRKNSNLQQVKKIIKATCCLLPLLGITNLFSFLEFYSKDMKVLLFTVWSYSTHIIDSFQGAILVIFHCFYAKEVRRLVNKKCRDLKEQLSPVLEYNLGIRRTKSLPAIWSTEQVHQSHASNELEMTCRCFPGKLQHLDLGKAMDGSNRQQGDLQQGNCLFEETEV